MELVLIDEAVSLVNQNVSTLCLDPSLLLEELLHGWVVLMARKVHLPVLVLPSECLGWNVFGVEVSDQSVVELVPVVLST